MVMHLRIEKSLFDMDPLKFLCFSIHTIHTTISTLPSYLYSVRETIDSLLCFFLALLYFHTLCVFNLSFFSRFLMYSSLTLLTLYLFIYPSIFLTLDSPSPAAYPLASPPFAISLLFSHDRSGDENPMTDFSSFTGSQNLRLERHLCTFRGLHRLRRYVLCCSYRKEDLVWLEFLGPMGKSELVWVVTPSLTSPKQHVSLENGRNKPSTVDS